MPVVRFKCGVIKLIVLSILLCFAPAATAQEDLQQQYAAYQTNFQKASQAFEEKKFQDCADLIAACKTELAAIVGATKNVGTRAKLKPQYERLKQAAVAVKKNGAKLDDFESWADFIKSSAAAAEMKNSSEPSGTEDGSLSFTKDIAPILNARCGGCHIRRASGQLSMATFESIQRGSRGVPLITPGRSSASRLIEVIESGEMPQGGQKVSEEELTKLKQWLDAGAPFDGDSPTAPILANAANTPVPDAMMNDNFVPPAEITVSFSRDVAPVLVENCKGCHIDANQLRGGLNMNSYNQMIRGGQSGNLFARGKGAESLLVRKLRGMEGQRMPVNRPALDNSIIAKIEKWIDEGASFDGNSPDAGLARVAELAWVANATPEELKAKRLEEAKKAWKRVFGRDNQFSASNDDFVVLSDQSQATAEKILTLASESAAEVKASVRVGKSEPLFPAGATIFVFDKRYDYSEFGKMAESRSLPNSWQAHWRRDGVNAYVAMQSGSLEEDELAKNLKINLTALWASSIKGMPAWFADGWGRFTYAGRAGRNDASVANWEQSAQNASRSMQSVQPLLQNSINEEDAASIGFVLVKALNQGASKKKFDAFIKFLKTADDFNAAFTEAYGPVDMAMAGFLGLKPK